MRVIFRAIVATPGRVLRAWTHPLRRRYVLWRIGESLIGLIVWALTGFAWWGVPLAVLIEWLAYEWVAEPLGWSGPYWERGPHEGESFK